MHGRPKIGSSEKCDSFRCFDTSLWPLHQLFLLLPSLWSLLSSTIDFIHASSPQHKIHQRHHHHHSRWRRRHHHQCIVINILKVKPVASPDHCCCSADQLTSLSSWKLHFNYLLSKRSSPYDQWSLTTCPMYITKGTILFPNFDESSEKLQTSFDPPPSFRKTSCAF